MGSGIVRRLDNLGRIVIPMEMRRFLDIGPEAEIEISVESNGIFLKPHKPGCAICGEEDDLVEANGSRICRSCLAAFNDNK